MPNKNNKEQWFIMIAGPNGAGKSTFYHEILKKDPFFNDASYINTDDITRELSHSQEPTIAQLVAGGRIVISEINRQMALGNPIIYETTGSGNMHLRLLENARAQGYKTASFFIGLSSKELAIKRVQHRFKFDNGHNVPIEDIKRRYNSAIENFPEMMMRSDISAIFDNSDRPYTSEEQKTRPKANTSQKLKQPNSELGGAYKLILVMDKTKFFSFHSNPKWFDYSIKIGNRKTRKDKIKVRRISTDALKDPSKLKDMLKCVIEQFQY